MMLCHTRFPTLWDHRRTCLRVSSNGSFPSAHPHLWNSFFWEISVIYNTINKYTQLNTHKCKHKYSMMNRCAVKEKTQRVPLGASQFGNFFHKPQLPCLPSHSLSSSAHLFLCIASWFHSPTPELKPHHIILIFTHTHAHRHYITPKDLMS